MNATKPDQKFELLNDRLDEHIKVFEHFVLATMNKSHNRRYGLASLREAQTFLREALKDDLKDRSRKHD